jgi:carbonic anhydrase/acetyltransferase-like protein (isoleucine patch superfamily)
LPIHYRYSPPSSKTVDKQWFFYRQSFCAVVPENREFPARSLIVGLPAKRADEVFEEQIRDIERGAREYVERAAAHRKSLGRL